MSSIKELIKKRLLVDMVQSVQPPGRWKIVVVDPKSIKILNTACRMHDILEENVTLVEDLTRKRQAYPNKEAIYFITPTESSVDRVIADFDKGNKAYAAVHLFFVAALPDHLFDKIKASPAITYVKTLKEMNVDFLACESQVFTMEQPLSLYNLYNPQNAPYMAAELTGIAQKMISVLSTLGDYPYIRYYGPPNSNTLSAKLAHRIQEELDALCRLDPDFPPPSPYKRSVLIIVDRSLDMVSPLVHEFTYQAMMNDLLVLEGGKYLYKSEGGVSTDANAAAVQTNSASLDENDPIWMLIRHWHYADAVEYIRKTFNNFLTDNKAAATALNQEGGEAGLKGVDSLKHMKDTLGSLPQFQEMKAKFSVHINICQECKSLFEKRQLDMIAAVEQDLATGENVDGRTIKFSNVMMDMVPVLDSDTISSIDKLRLLMLYIITQNGIEDDERRRLLGYAKLSLEDSQAITNLNFLGVRLSKSKDKKQNQDERGKYAYHAHHKASKKRKGESYDLSRWAPVIKSVLQDQIRNQLDATIFPWVTEPPPEDAVPAPPPPPPTGKTPREKALSLIPPDPSRPNSLRTTRASWATARKKPVEESNSEESQQKQQQQQQQAPVSELRKNGPRIILFSIGGLTFSEMRATYEVIQETQRDVVTGTTHIYNATQLVESLKDLANPVPTSEVAKSLTASGDVYNTSPTGKPDLDSAGRSSTSASLARDGKEGKDKEKGLRGMFGKKKEKG
ncbi:Sec1-like protein [Phlyctochytrium arcticum]|nr:Sec1-like protein [Phlyctochytrium arcticum]